MEGAGDESSLKTTAQNPNFVSDYFSASRLHFIGSFRARYESMMAAIAERLGVPPEKLLNPPARRVAEDGGRRKRERTIVHVDMDAFFASVAVRDHPELRGKPIAVCHASGNDSKPSDFGGFGGEISSCSYEARTFGVHAGMLLREGRRRCPRLVAVPYDFSAYERVSIAIYALFYSMIEGAVVQAQSVDEAYIDLTYALSSRMPSMPSADGEDFLVQKLRNDIYAETGCHASAGIGPSKLTARIATSKAKPNGQMRIQQEQVLEFIGELPVCELPGIGWRTVPKLHELGGETCLQMRKIPLEKLQAEFGEQTGRTYYDLCRGIDGRTIEPLKPRKSIGAEVSWGVRFGIEDGLKVRKFVRDMAGEVAARCAAASATGRKVTYKAYRRKQNAGRPGKYLGCGSCDVFTKSDRLDFRSTVDFPEVLATVCVRLHFSLKINHDALRGVGIQISDITFHSLGVDTAGINRMAAGINQPQIESFFKTTRNSSKDVVADEFVTSGLRHSGIQERLGEARTRGNQTSFRDENFEAYKAEWKPSATAAGNSKEESKPSATAPGNSKEESPDKSFRDDVHEAGTASHLLKRGKTLTHDSARGSSSLLDGVEHVRDRQAKRRKGNGPYVHLDLARTRGTPYRQRCEDERIAVCATDVNLADPNRAEGRESVTLAHRSGNYAELNFDGLLTPDVSGSKDDVKTIPPAIQPCLSVASTEASKEMSREMSRVSVPVVNTGLDGSFRQESGLAQTLLDESVVEDEIQPDVKKNSGLGPAGNSRMRFIDKDETDRRGLRPHPDWDPSVFYALPTQIRSELCHAQDPSTEEDGEDQLRTLRSDPAVTPTEARESPSLKLVHGTKCKSALSPDAREFVEGNEIPASWDKAVFDALPSGIKAELIHERKAFSKEGGVDVPSPPSLSSESQGDDDDDDDDDDDVPRRCTVIAEADADPANSVSRVDQTQDVAEQALSSNVFSSEPLWSFADQLRRWMKETANHLRSGHVELLRGRLLEMARRRALTAVHGDLNTIRLFATQVGGDWHDGFNAILRDVQDAVGECLGVPLHIAPLSALDRHKY